MSNNKTLYVKMPKIDFWLTKIVFDVFAEDYNTDKVSREKLKAVHAEVYYDLVRQFRIKLEERKKLPQYRAITLDPRDLTLNTNNVATGRRVHRSKETVARAITRLINAGVIKKTNHGRRRNYEITFRADMLAILDDKNPHFFPKLQNVNVQFVSNSVTSFCNVVSVTYLETNKKQINVIKGVNDFVTETKKRRPNKGVNDFVTETKKRRHKIGDTPNQITPPLSPTLNSTSSYPEAGAPNTTQTEKSHITKLREKYSSKPPHQHEKEEKITSKEAYTQELKKYNSETENYRQKVAIYLVELYLFLIFFKKNPHFTLYPPAKDKTIEYVKEVYLNTTNRKLLVNKLNEYKEALFNAADYSEKHENYKAPAPINYFDINNHSNSFRKAIKLMKNKAEWAKTDKIRKQIRINKRRLTDVDKLNSAIASYLKNKNFHELRKQETYIKNNVPHLHDKFMQGIAYERYYKVY